MVSRNQLSVLTNDNVDVLEEVVGHSFIHYENENDNDRENGTSPLNSA